MKMKVEDDLGELSVPLLPSVCCMLSSEFDRELKVPVTAKLSKQFYDQLGEGVANELVEWFNLVDATYKAELRELNELNFARFDAKLEQRLTELRSDVRLEMHTGFAAVSKDIAAVRKEIAEAIGSAKSDLMKWSFVFWVGAVAAIAMLAGVFNR
jgi:hypothetical protein